MVSMLETLENQLSIEEGFRLVKQHIVQVMLEFIVLDEDGNVIDTLLGVVNGGSMNVDSGSSVRRTASISLTPNKQITNVTDKSLIWLDKNVKINLGILDLKKRHTNVSNEKDRYIWFPMGIYVYESASTTYDAGSNVLSIELSDFALKLDGTVNGQVGGAITTVLQAYEENETTGEPISYTSIKKAIEDILKSAGITDYRIEDIGEYYAMERYNPDGYEEYREMHPLWNMIPYDLEFSAGCSVWDMISECVELYPNYDAAFDKDGTFVVEMIPSEYAEKNDFEYEDYKDLIISEQTQTPLTGVKNICEVWGESMDADWYCDSIAVDGNSYQLGIKEFGEKYRTSNKIGIKFIAPEDNLYMIDFYKLIDEKGNDTHNWSESDLARYLNCVGLDGQKKIPIKVGLFDDIWEFDSEHSHNPNTWTETEFFKYNNFISATITQLGQYSIKYEQKENLMMKVNDLPILAIEDKNTGLTFDFADIDYDHINIFYVNKLKAEVTNEYVIRFRNLLETKGENCTTWTINDFANFLYCLSRYNPTSDPSAQIDIKKIPITDELFDEILAYDDEHYHDPATLTSADFSKYNYYIGKVKDQLTEADYYYEFTYLGIEQPHAIDVLVNNENITDKEKYKNPYTEEQYSKWVDYFKALYNCDNVSITVIEDSPFSVEKIGKRIDVKEGSEFDNITSNQLALERAIYENWKNSRLTDDVSITTKIIPFLKPYMKVSYKKTGFKDEGDFIIKSISHDFDNGTSTISMYTFYPLYRQTPGMNKRMTYKYMSGYHNEDLYGNQDEKIT